VTQHHLINVDQPNHHLINVYQLNHQQQSTNVTFLSSKTTFTTTTIMISFLTSVLFR